MCIEEMVFGVNILRSTQSPALLHAVPSFEHTPHRSVNLTVIRINTYVYTFSQISAVNMSSDEHCDIFPRQP